MKRSTLLILLFFNVLWAGTYSTIKMMMAHAPFFLITSLRYLIALAPLLLIAYWRHGLAMNHRDLLRCGIIGVATFTLTPALMYAGVDMSRAADAAIITAMEPLLVSIGAYFYLRERIDRRTQWALVLAFGGTLVLSEFWRATGHLNLLGTMLILLAVFFETSYSVLGKELLQRHEPLKITAWAVTFGCVINVVSVTALDLWPQSRNLTGTDWAILVIYLAVICTGLGYTIWYAALKEDSTSKVAITIFTQPAFGILAAWFLVAETPTVAQIIGTSIIIFAVSLVVIHRRTFISKKTETNPPPARSKGFS